MTTGHTILEIKFTGRYPAWVPRLVRAFELEVTPGVEVRHVDDAVKPARVLRAGVEDVKGLRRACP